MSRWEWEEWVGGGTVKCCRHLNSKMKDRWAYLNVLPERRVGSYKASHLWGGLWASIDWEKEGARVKEWAGERDKERGRGWERSWGSTLAHEFHPFPPKIKHPNKYMGIQGSEPGKSTSFDWLPGTVYQINTPTPPTYTTSTILHLFP